MKLIGCKYMRNYLVAQNFLRKYFFCARVTDSPGCNTASAQGKTRLAG
jgi:hypothetical protein